MTYGQGASTIQTVTRRKAFQQQQSQQRAVARGISVEDPLSMLKCTVPTDLVDAVTDHLPVEPPENEIDVSLEQFTD